MEKINAFYEVLEKKNNNIKLITLYDIFDDLKAEMKSLVERHYFGSKIYELSKEEFKEEYLKDFHFVEHVQDLRDYIYRELRQEVGDGFRFSSLNRPDKIDEMYIIIEKGSTFYLKSIPLRKDFQRT